MTRFLQCGVSVVVAVAAAPAEAPRERISSDAGKRIVLEVDGAMSYAAVWLNGKLVVGWPYGYNSWQLDLTPFVVPGGKNLPAIRLDHPLPGKMNDTQD